MLGRFIVMKRNSIVLLASLILLSACGSKGGGGKSKDLLTGGAITASPGAVADLSEAIKLDLQFLREEEKLARDVYLELYDRWDLKAHNNIAASEQTHMDAVAAVLDAYGLQDPVVSDEEGAFTNTTLADLYAQLVATGSASQEASLVVGATIEDLDIHDIQRMRTETTDAYTLQILDVLECGSRNHMRSFNSQLVSRGGSYEAQYIDAELLASILSSDSEKCGSK
jgi:hypothetical protein